MSPFRTELVRCPDSSSVSCTSFIRSEVETYISNLNAFKKATREATSLNALNSIYSEELKSHLREGARLYLNQDNKFVFHQNIREILDASGVRRASVFRASHNGSTYFIKKLSQHSTLDSIVNEIQNAKLLHLAGLSPRTHLVRVSNSPYLVMDFVPGVNIKEVILPHSRTKNTKSRIDAATGLNSPSLRESVKSFARMMLADSNYTKRLLEIIQNLEQLGFTDTSDFQFMVDLTTGPQSIKIIDSQAFHRHRKYDGDTSSPKASLMQNLLKLRTLAE